MKKVFVLAALSLLLFNVGSVFADPFIVSDPVTEASVFRIRLSADNGQTWGGWVEGPPATGALRFDLATTPAGTYLGQAQAGADISVTDSATGITTTSRQWSQDAPFVLRVPTNPRAPVKVRIINQN